MRLRGLILLLTLCGSGTAGAFDPVVLTISGNIGDPNRGAPDAFADPMFNYLGIDFERARAVTLGDIRALPQARIETGFDNWPDRPGGAGHVCEGPTLDDVLALARPLGTRFLTRALDGFAWPYDAATTNLDQVIVAHTVDGAALHIGGRGPLMLCMTPGTYPGQSRRSDTGLTWALFHIEVE